MVWSKETPLAESWVGRSTPVVGSYEDNIATYDNIGVGVIYRLEDKFIKALPLANPWFSVNSYDEDVGTYDGSPPQSYDLTDTFIKSAPLSNTWAPEAPL